MLMIVKNSNAYFGKRLAQNGIFYWKSFHKMIWKFFGLFRSPISRILSSLKIILDYRRFAQSNLDYSRIILTLLKNLAFCFNKFLKKADFSNAGLPARQSLQAGLHPSRKPSRIQKFHYVRF